MHHAFSINSYTESNGKCFSMPNYAILYHTIKIKLTTLQLLNNGNSSNSLILHYSNTVLYCTITYCTVVYYTTLNQTTTP